MTSLKTVNVLLERNFPFFFENLQKNKKLLKRQHCMKQNVMLFDANFIYFCVNDCCKSAQYQTKYTAFFKNASCF